MVRVVFPAQFQQMLKGELEHHGTGSNLREVLASICEQRPDLRKVLFLASGDVSPFVAFSKIGANDIYPATSSGSVTLQPGDAVEVILAMAGG